jgi:hypothetical protein
VRLYGPPQPSGYTHPTGSSQPTGPSQAVGPFQPSQTGGSLSRLVTRARNIVPTVEEAIEVLEANQRKRKKPE